MRNILFDKIGNVNLSMKNNQNYGNDMCIPNEEFLTFGDIIINKYNTIMITVFIILILLLIVIIKFFQLIKKKHIEYREDYDKTVITINHLV